MQVINGADTATQGLHYGATCACLQSACMLESARRRLVACLAPLAAHIARPSSSTTPAHPAADPGNQISDQLTPLPANALYSDGMHTFGLEWSKDAITSECEGCFARAALSSNRPSRRFQNVPGCAPSHPLPLTRSVCGRRGDQEVHEPGQQPDGLVERGGGGADVGTL